MFVDSHCDDDNGGSGSGVFISPVFDLLLSFLGSGYCLAWNFPSSKNAFCKNGFLERYCLNISFYHGMSYFHCLL